MSVIDAARARGLTVSNIEMGIDPLIPDMARVDEFDELVAWFEQAEPRDAPIMLLTNQEMLLFATGRPPAFPEYETTFFLAGWQMMPESRTRQIDHDDLIARLESAPAIFVVDRDDRQAQSFRETFPELVEEVLARAREEVRIGGYVVSRIGG